MKSARTARVRERGQLTIPAGVRREAGLEKGSVVEFEVHNEGLLLRPRLVVDDLELDDDFVRSVIESTVSGYEDLRGDPDAWAAELSERALLEESLADGLED